MNIVTTLIITLLCLGAVQGIVYGIILIRYRGPNKLANRLLSAILFFLSYHLIDQTLLLFGLGKSDIWYHLMNDFNWIYGSLIYLFVKALVVPNYKLKGKEWMHFIPVGIQFICSNFVRTQNFYWDGTKESLTWLGYWGYAIWMNYPTVYVIASLLIIYYAFKADKLLRNSIRSEEIVLEKVTWIKKVIFAFKVYFSVVLLTLIIDFLVFDISFKNFYFYFTRFYYYPLYIGIALLTYWLGIIGFHKKDQVILKVKPNLSAKEREQLLAIEQQLKIKMASERLYKDPNLTLTSLANHLQIKPYLLTKCLSNLLDKQFNLYINELRIEEMKELLQDQKNKNFTLLSLAFEAGFNSKASFNRAVKKITGKSPKDLKDSIQ